MLFGVAQIRVNEPAYRESEKDYFLRIAAEDGQLKREEARQMRKQKWAKRLRAVTKLWAKESTPAIH